MECRQALDFTGYLDTVRGVWAGKFIGGTLGAPIEGVKERHQFDGGIAPAGIAENDDTDLQLLWLHALEEHGVKLCAENLMQEWREHVRAPWNEYGVAAANWECGIRPPESGRLNNWFWGECMGGPIRSEIWGLICPGAPRLAARYAAMDGSLDHAGEAIEAEKFLASLEAALFFEKDLAALIEIGLQQVDPASRIASLVRDVQVWTRTLDWSGARERVRAVYGHPDMTHSLQNVGFTMIGLLCGGGDFGRTLALTLNCGYDADCTAGTAAAILGGILGYEGIPARFRDAVPGEYRVSDWMLGFPRTGRLTDLSLACCHLGRDVAEAWQTGVEISAPTAPRPAALPVSRFGVPAVRGPRQRFPSWRIVGPCWRAWDERRSADLAAGEHGISGLPSVQYFTHDQSGFDREFLSPRQLAFDRMPALREQEQVVRHATSDLVPLDGLVVRGRPGCHYAAAEFDAPAEGRAWLMIGATGPVEVWLNEQSVLHSETYQPLTPTTFPILVSVQSGRNQLVLKLACTSQPLGAYVAFKRYDGAHWHQSFYETRFDWCRPLSDIAPS